MQRGVIRYSSHIRIVNTYRRMSVLGTRYGTTVEMDGRCCFRVSLSFLVLGHASLQKCMRAGVCRCVEGALHVQNTEG